MYWLVPTFLWEFYMGTATGWNHPAQISWSLVTHWPSLLWVNGIQEHLCVTHKGFVAHTCVSELGRHKWFIAYFSWSPHPSQCLTSEPLGTKRSYCIKHILQISSTEWIQLLLFKVQYAETYYGWVSYIPTDAKFINGKHHTQLLWLWL